MYSYYKDQFQLIQLLSVTAMSWILELFALLLFSKCFVWIVKLYNFQISLHFFLLWHHFYIFNLLYSRSLTAGSFGGSTLLDSKPASVCLWPHCSNVLAIFFMIISEHNNAIMTLVKIVLDRYQSCQPPGLLPQQIPLFLCLPQKKYGSGITGNSQRSVTNAVMTGCLGLRSCHSTCLEPYSCLLSIKHQFSPFLPERRTTVKMPSQ